MDDPGWSWPAWKFGLKREDLFTNLHDQYNTFPSSIQDPEAFHHDVFEISHTATTKDEFHRLLSDRRDLRLRELNESLESASLEIIANPKLIGTQQWQYALQLFRTKSLDSLVRYFSSYLPDDHPWRHPEDDAQTNSTSSVSDSVTDSDSVSTNSSKPFFDDDDHDFLTHEPLTIHTSINACQLPPSPRSLTMCSDSPAASPIDIAHCDYGLSTPARTMSFSENESDIIVPSGMLSHHIDDVDDDTYDETSQSDDLDTPITSISDVSETVEFSDSVESHNESITPAECEDAEESETPTPRNEAHGDSYMLLETTTLSKKSHKSIHRPSQPLYTQVLHDYVRSTRKGQRDGSPKRTVRRTSPEEGRIQKPTPDPIRIRPKARRRDD